jgi:hypothetical protein
MSDTHLELYQSFIEFVKRDIQGERRLMNRRIFGVFLWCFVIPAILTLGFVLGLRLGTIPLRFGHYADWIIVAFPVAYTLHVLSFDLLREIPTAYRRGGVAATLGRAFEEARWRERVCDDLRAQLLLPSADHPHSRRHWAWLVKTFDTDLVNLQHRTRYLTALAGSVFFLLLKGLDFLDLPTPMAHPSGYILGWFESSSSNVAQFTGLALFLVLLYLSGNQAYVSLSRYLHCLELIEVELNQEDKTG